MTREEAIKIWRAIVDSPDRNAVIDGFAALGMLKFDEPRSGRDKLRDFLRDRQHYDTTAPIWDDLDRALDGAGLKIVEK